LNTNNYDNSEGTFLDLEKNKLNDTNIKRPGRFLKLTFKRPGRVKTMKIHIGQTDNDNFDNKLLISAYKIKVEVTLRRPGHSTVELKLCKSISN
jgi:hypothetical protein